MTRRSDVGVALVMGVVITLGRMVNDRATWLLEPFMRALVLFSFLFMSQGVHAQVNAPALTTTATATEAPQDLKPAVTLLYEVASTLAREATSQTGLYRLDGSLPLFLGLTGTIRAGYLQEYSYVLDDGSAGDFIDARVGIVSSSSSLQITLPASRASQRNGLQSAIGWSLPLDWRIRNFDLLFSPGLTQFFFSREYRADGVVNPDWGWSVTLSPSFNFTERFSALVSATFAESYTSWGFAHTKTIAAFEMDYQISKRIATALGVTTMASTLKNGIQDTFVFYDQSAAGAYFDLSLTL